MKDKSTGERFNSKSRKEVLITFAKFFVKNYMKVIIFLFFVVLISLTLNFHITAINGIDYIVYHDIGNETNRTLIINKILMWEKENIVDLNLKENGFYPCIRIPTCLIGSPPNCLFNPLLLNYYLISITRCGRCGEFAGMFSELANKFGIQTKVIYADNINGGNHAWVEIIQGNETIPIWTSDLKDYDISKFYDWYNASKFYDCKLMIKYRNINNGSEDISKKYYNWCS